MSVESRTRAAWTREVNGGNGGSGLNEIGVLVIDEAAMVDDRALAALLRHAVGTGTKVVGIARTHRLVGGLKLTENRRRRNLVERAALLDRRTDARTSAPAAPAPFAADGRVHAEDTTTKALTAMLDAWNAARARWAGHPHGQVTDLFLFAAHRTDVAALNVGARAALVACGEVEQGCTYRPERLRPTVRSARTRRLRPPARCRSRRTGRPHRRPSRPRSR